MSKKDKIGYIDYKSTIWARLHLEAEDSNCTLKDVQKILDTNPTISNLISNITEDIRYETMYHTEEELSPTENGGKRTIEIYSTKDKLLWDNAPKSELKHLFIHIEVQDGERRHDHKVLHCTTAKNINFAAEKYVSTFGGYGKVDKKSRWWNYGGWAGRLKHVEELTSTEYEILKRFL